MVKTAFWDVDTQNDFLLSDGRLYLRGAEGIRPNLRKLYGSLKQRPIPVVATMETHSPSDEELRLWPPHCLVGTEGQQKVPETLLEKRVVVPYDRAFKAPPLIPGGQIILEKCHLDCFSNPRAAEVVLASDIEQWVVFGVATDYAVRQAVLGLLKLGCRVTVISDAVHGAGAETSRQAEIEMQSAGAEFMKTVEFLQSLPARRSRPRGRKRTSPRKPRKKGKR